MHRLALCALLSSSGCAAFYHAEANHAQRPACLTWSGPSTVDLALGAAGTTALLVTDEYRQQPAYLAIPAVLLLSGTYYAISEYRCRHADDASPHDADRPTAFDWSAYPACSIDHPTECDASSTCTLVDTTHARCMPR